MKKGSKEIGSRENKLLPKEKEIIHMVYRFRYIDRIQVQYFLGHTYHGRVNIWLKHLVHEQYLGKDITPNERRKPSIYYLESRGIDYLKKHLYLENKTLHKFYHEERVSFITKNHCLAAGNIAIAFGKLRNDQTTIEYYTESDIASEEYYKDIKPDGYCKIIQNDSSQDYCIEVDLETERIKTFQEKIDRYLTFVATDKWKRTWKQFPTILVICVTQKRLDSLLLTIEQEIEEYSYPPVIWKLTTIEDIEKEKLRGSIWRTAMKKGKEILR